MSAPTFTVVPSYQGRNGACKSIQSWVLCINGTRIDGFATKHKAVLAGQSIISKQGGKSC